MHDYAIQILKDSSTTFKGYQRQVQAGAQILDLSIGEIQLEQPAWLDGVIASGAASARRGYGDPQGLLALRQTYAGYLREQGYDLNESNILITAGAKEALWIALISVLARGGSVLLPGSSWPPYVMWARALGGELILYDPLSPYLAEEIGARLREHRPDALLLNFPHNPTGAEISQATLARVMSMAAQSNTTVLSDEVYRYFSALERPGSVLDGIVAGTNGLIHVDSVSKMLGLAGLRIGFLVADPSTVKKLEVIRSSFGSCVSLTAQAVASAMLQDPRCRSWQTTISESSRAARQAIARLLGRHGYEVESQGALYVWARHPLSDRTDESDLVSLGNTLIKVTPGSLFGSAGHFRVCPVRPATTLASLFVEEVAQLESEQMSYDKPLLPLA